MIRKIIRSDHGNPVNEAVLDRVVRLAIAEDASNGRRSWTQEEDQFLRANLGWMTDAEIAEALGRTPTAVHLRWDRDLQLCGPSKAPGVITAHKAAELLGIDGHKIAHWVDMGLIPGRLMAGGRKIRLIQRAAWRRWVLNPMNWVYFDPDQVQDTELKRMLAKRAKRWGDEWWTTRQVADHLGGDTSDVKRYIKLGRIRSFRLPVSLGGRHEERKWSNHFVLKSEATRPDLKFLRRGDNLTNLTPRGQAWMKKALRMGLNATEIGRTMGYDAQTVTNWIRKFFPKAKIVRGRYSHSQYRNRRTVK
jgi:hypothetical protein